MTTATQRRLALQRANAIRSRRHNLKADLRDGRTSLADVLDRPEPWLAGMEIHELLRMPQRGSRERVSKALRRAEIWPLETVGSLNLPTRARLLETLMEKPKPNPKPLTVVAIAVLQEMVLLARPVIAGEIADAIGVHGSTLGATLGGLASRGLICRAGRDRWQAWAVTAEGRERLSPDGVS